MISSQTVREVLKAHIWEEGKLITVVEGPFRYRTVVRCSVSGRQKAQFANGEFTYGVFIQCMNGKGVWVPRGGNIVPVLPDGRILMVVEQRQLVALFPEAPRLVRFGDGHTIDLGETGALEFPGGGVESGESLTIGSLRELFQETGIAGQKAVLYCRVPGIMAFNADIAGINYYYVAFLSSGHFENYVQDDGGLNVFALTERGVERNIRSGVISSGQAAIISWAFYQQVTQARKEADYQEELIQDGYLKIEEVVINP